MDAGESAAEACEREVLEETGLTVKVDKLIGVYSNPHRVIEHLGGRRTQGVALNFEAKVVSGKLTITEETTEVGYYSPEEMQSMAVWDHHWERINDALAGVSTAFIR
jgi:ADP-ribose pyrophosphatase YjhB (NUDIX family)